MTARGDDTGDLVAWLVKRREPVELLDSIVIVNEAGEVVATTPLPYGARGPQGWNGALARLGFTRLSVWREAEDGRGFRCVVRSS